MPDETVKADAGTRRVVIVIIALAVLLAALIVGKVLPWFQGYVQGLEPGRAIATLKIVLVVLFLSVIPAGLYIFRLGRRVVRDERFPPLGMKVIKDTRLITGRRAKARGNVLILFAGALMAMGLIGAAYAWIAADRIVQLGM